MLKNPKKADLDKDGKLSGYEKKRGMAIEKSMSGKKFGGAMKLDKSKIKKANLGLLMMKKAKDKGAKGLEFLSPLAMLKRVSGKKKGGVMKYTKGGGADSGRIGELKSKLAVAKDKFKKKGIRGISPQQRERLKEIFEKKFPKTMTPLAKKEKAKGISTKAFMGGGMINKPMGYKSGTSVMARGCKLGRKKATKIT